MAPFTTNSSSKRSADTKDKKASTKNLQDPAAEVREDVSSTSRPLSPVTNQSFDSKDTRAYEHARQRSKHAQDFAKKRAKKEEKAEQRKAAAAAAARGSSSGGSAATGKTSGGAPGVAGHGKTTSSGGGAGRVVAKPDVEVDEDEILMAPIERGASDKPSRPLPLSPPSSPMLYKPDNTIRVNLADLIVVSDKKTKKAGLKRADDFEVVPHVKAVIALDDTDDFEMELDEPWEHIQVDEGKGRGRFKAEDEPSYAKVVAGMATPVALD